MEEATALATLALPQTNLETISRPSSTSTSESASAAAVVAAASTVPQLPGISALAQANNSATSSPQMREAIPAPAPVAASTPTQAPAPAPAPAPTPTYASGGGSTTPTCQNCQTSTTPLWRRDEYGSVLCNACGLFLKLHGRPRPISLKTDVIKSRNRVKTMRPDLASKKKQQQQQQQAHQFGANDPNGLDIHGQNQRRQSQKSNGNPDGSDSPVSRTATPSLYNPSLPVFQGMDDAQLQAGLQGFNVSGSDNRSGSPLNGDRHLDVPQTHEQLIAANSALKTRVSELELINELFRGRLSQMEQDEASARRGQEISGKAEAQLRAQLESSKKQLDESHRRENNLKRRLDEMELELKEARDALDLSDSGRAAKKPRIAEVVANPAVAAATSGGGGDGGGGGGESEVSTPQSAAAT
ncbi:GATA zinc finger [Colletotrichum scovillei]|uniref:GATA transcription factor AreB n=1 Tax=Colletotrichum scovillei TaxID=1209932 RepID=A0A9P7R4Y4_9PEZI|nr:GATA zinc finger [Colletotrichum scovillei]KAF4773864.1 GATA zinc finger [Colletotrichum scovillei]KAG7048762.1 GATA transcription factor AreB [Colletotrichum scovillei]KAG7065921.1 GATA transcription factor AreB [Colletotrichum scovillei]KAG7068527.1 GATA transcription factor AreB [Colletotrichum scovillei]